jgi:hypothetical protein
MCVAACESNQSLPCLGAEPALAIRLLPIGDVPAKEIGTERRGGRNAVQPMPRLTQRGGIGEVGNF